MTAEIAVMNHSCVALAADSAVSIGPEAKKIYTSADKLFQLSNTAPIGIMINGGANFTGLPWETIIKVYRRKLGDKTFPKLSDYANDFISFLTNNPELFTEDQQNGALSDLIKRFFLEVRRMAKEALNHLATELDGLTNAQIQAILNAITLKILKDIRAKPFIEGLSSKSLPAIREKYSEGTTEARKLIFGSLPMTKATKARLITLGIEFFARRHFISDPTSGIVIAGFGEKEYIPGLLSFNFQEMIVGRPRLIRNKPSHLSSSTTSRVIPFAQGEMVYSFMQGIDADLEGLMCNSTSDLISGIVEVIIAAIELKDSKLATTIKDEMDKKLGPTIGKLFAGWKEAQQNYWQPVVQIVTVLPKDELAMMAENLVNLTKFRRRVTTSSETVGGPIDIAIITKGDGFIWYKRKHYFDPELNPRAISRLQGK